MGCTQDDPMFQWDQMDPAIREKELTRNAVARYIEQRQKHKMNMQWLLFNRKGASKAYRDKHTLLKRLMDPRLKTRADIDIQNRAVLKAMHELELRGLMKTV